MSRSTRTISPDYFEDLYATNIDPWKFASSEYEREKYAQTLAALPEASYGRALEVGCSIGVLTYQLASRCQYLLAVDAARAPLEEARQLVIRGFFAELVAKIGIEDLQDRIMSAIEAELS